MTDVLAGAVVGLYGPTRAPQRLLVQLEDGGRVVTAVLDPEQAKQIAAATQNLLTARSRGDQHYLVHWLLPPLPITLRRDGTDALTLDGIPS